MEGKIFTIEDSNKIEFNSFLAGQIFLIVFINIALPLAYMFFLEPMLDVMYVITIILFVDPWIILLLKKNFKMHLPIKRIKIMINDSKMEIYIRERLYLEILWSRISLIDLINIKWEGYKIIFHNDTHYTLRLFYLLTHKKKINQFLILLKEIAKRKKIEIAERKEKKDNEEESLKQFESIKKLMKIKKE